jgi:transposase
MKMQVVFMGIDISKQWLDVCLNQQHRFTSHRIKNNLDSIAKFFGNRPDHEQLIIGMEHTGRYNWALLSLLANTNHKVYVIGPLHLHRSLGLVRGKTDKVDAERICKFIRKNHHELSAWRPRRPVITELGVLLSQRKRLLKVKGQIQRGQNDIELVGNSDSRQQLTDINAELVCELTKKIKKIDRMIRYMIGSDEYLSQQDGLLQSITGVGEVLSWNLIYKTNEFKSIEDPRKLACYAGVVPFEHSSGTSIRGKHRVSPYADRKFKSILHMAALRAIRIDGELRSYYLRKVEQGKNKMSVLNAVRNKIIHRAFAVIKHKNPYIPCLVMS